MTLGVIVPVRDEAESLPSLLASVAPFLAARDPVVVVDDGSLDRSAEIAENAAIGLIQIGPRIPRKVGNGFHTTER